MSTLARRMLLLVPAGLILALVAATHGAQGRHAVEIKICRHRMADGRNAQSLDLRKLEAGYVSIARHFKGALDRAKARPKRFDDPGHRSGIPGCARRGTRRVSLDVPLPARLRGKTLYFVPGGSSRLKGALGKNALVFLTDYPSLRAAGLRAREWGAPVSAASSELARRLKVRCASSMVRVSKDGSTLEIREELP